MHQKWSQGNEKKANRRDLAQQALAKPKERNTKKRQQVVEQERKLLGIPIMDQPISLLPLQKLVVRMPFSSACSGISFQTLPRS